MKGFFTREQTKSKSRPDGKTYSCASCGLYQYVLSPRMEAHGNFKKGILNIGEGPGEDEDRKGKPWQGKVGRRLQRMYRRFGIDLFEDCLNINAVNCKPPNNRNPSDYEIACCRAKVLNLIEQYQPHVIMVFGNAAIKSILGHRWKKDLGGITKWRGWTIPDRDLGVWVCPTYHPSFIERGQDEAVETIWEQDLERAFTKMDESLPKHEDERNYVNIIKDETEMEQVLNNVQMGNKGELACVDYETTGLKPHARGHRIVAAGIATSSEQSYAFLMPKRKHQRVKFGRLLASQNVGKIAYNMKFEENWSQVRLGYGVQPWVWDGMLAAHILDNRQGICSLDFQVYTHFGVVDYSSHITPFLKGREPKNANSFNRIYDLIDKFGEDTLLEYCALDTIFEFKLAQVQAEKLGLRLNGNRSVTV